ncbi:MAG TPA: mRNA surveillance protein pelota [Thermoplasmata archaeon]|nr:mRNA surveillance protein pelota [Thermoplasmata archaeon]
MKIVYRDMKKGVVKLVPETMDDLWHLQYIMDKGDLVKALTFRTAEQDDDKVRSKKAEKKPMVLGIRVEDVEFHQFSDRLRIHGIIEEGPQNLGSYHTITIRAGEFKEVTILKEEWNVRHLKRLEEAVQSSKKVDIVFVSMDDDEAVAGVIRQSGIQVFAEIASHRSGKLYKSSDNEKEYFAEIIAVLKNIKQKATPLLIVGPGFAKDRLVAYGREKTPELFTPVFLHGTGNSGLSGVYEAMKGGAAEKIGKENRVVLETRLMEQLFEEIAKDGYAIYGIKEVEDALKSGAVSDLLILDKIAKSEKGEELLTLAKEVGSVFSIINSTHDAGKRLEGLGGVAALLRFK